MYHGEHDNNACPYNDYTHVFDINLDNCIKITNTHEQYFGSDIDKICYEIFKCIGSRLDPGLENSILLQPDGSYIAGQNYGPILDKHLDNIDTTINDKKLMKLLYILIKIRQL